MTAIKEVLFRNIEDNIAPVIYFHQLDPAIAAQEVSEYVFTSRTKGAGVSGGGIHEQMVNLLQQINTAIAEGHKLPASWISGFFGSGKSSFAKLLGLALDHLNLPDGKDMLTALLERDDTPNCGQLKESFKTLEQQIKTRAVIFDIGTAAKNNESVPHTIYREVLHKLGYSAHDGVAYYEIALEEEGKYEEFLKLYEAQYGKPWSAKKDSPLATGHFRAMYKKIYPDEGDLMEVLTFNINSLSIKDMVKKMVSVTERRAPGVTFFVIVDEVSQYIISDSNKMLDLQSFVSEVGGRARPGHSPLWLLVTGQEKLEEETKGSVLFKLQDRFPPALRVHLDRTNVREVVSRRLLKKKSNSPLEELLSEKNLNALKLHGYDCENVTAEQLRESYPLLPAHIHLFMDITQCIRNTSRKSQSDAGGVRSVLNNIWDLFNREPIALKDKPLGTLLSLDMLYDVIGSSLDSDVQLTLNRAFEKYDSDSWEVRVIKAISLLEMNAEHLPVMPKLLASLLYSHLGDGNCMGQVEEALGKLDADNWIQYHEKNGWQIQNNAAQDWNKTKEGISIPTSQIVESILEIQGELLGNIAMPVYENARFPIESYWGFQQKIKGKNDPTHVKVSFLWESNKGRRDDIDNWLDSSRKHPGQFIWVSSETSQVESIVRQYERGRKMIARFKAQGQLQPMQQQLLYREEADSERLRESIKNDLKSAWLTGRIYFEGSSIEPQKDYQNFDNALRGVVEANLGTVFHKFKQGNISITESDFKQLLEKDVSGLSLVFFDENNKLGICKNDAGKIVFQCDGPVPSEIYRFLEEKSYQTGEQLNEYFGGSPYGYASIIIRASIIGLLCEQKIKIIAASKDEITSIQDPGARSIFEGQREFNKSEIEISKDSGLEPRDRISVKNFFERQLELKDVQPTNDFLADLVFKHFPALKDRASVTIAKLNSFCFQIPQTLGDFNQSLTECLEKRQMLEVLKRVKQNLDTLSRGMETLKELEQQISRDAEEELRILQGILQREGEQLKEVDNHHKVSDALEKLAEHFEGGTPWRSYADIKPDAQKIRDHYISVRKAAVHRQQEALDAAVDGLKVREGYSRLEEDQQHEVVQMVKQVWYDIDDEAVQPTLVFISQQPSRIQEAAARAHVKMDDFLNEDPDPVGGKVHTVRAGLRNREISSREQLERMLEELREKCIQELEQGFSVRLED